MWSLAGRFFNAVNGFKEWEKALLPLYLGTQVIKGKVLINDNSEACQINHDQQTKKANAVDSQFVLYSLCKTT